jgi:hypothetical protein
MGAGGFVRKIFGGGGGGGGGGSSSNAQAAAEAEAARKRAEEERDRQQAELERQRKLAEEAAERARQAKIYADKVEQVRLSAATQDSPTKDSGASSMEEKRKYRRGNATRLTGNLGTDGTVTTAAGARLGGTGGNL